MVRSIIGGLGVGIYYSIVEEFCQWKNYIMLVLICDMIKGNMSLVENFNFYFLAPQSHNLKMLSIWCKPHYNWTSGYRVVQDLTMLKQKHLNPVFANIFDIRLIPLDHVTCLLLYGEIYVRRQNGIMQCHVQSPYFISVCRFGCSQPSIFCYILVI